MGEPKLPQISDIELAALVASKICHDVVGPVGAIYNGIEILDEDDDGEARSYALEVIRNVTVQASAHLQFARFAFGAAGSAGAEIDLTTAERISAGFVATGKQQLSWHGPAGFMAKDKVKVLLNLIAAAVTALPRGGEIRVAILGGLEAPRFELTCAGQAARPPRLLAEVLDGQVTVLDAMNVQAYYTYRLAKSAGMSLAIEQRGGDVVLSAKPAAS